MDWTQYSLEFLQYIKYPDQNDLPTDHIMPFSGYCGADVFLFKTYDDIRPRAATIKNCKIFSVENGMIFECDNDIVLRQSFGENNYALVDIRDDGLTYTTYVISTSDIMADLGGSVNEVYNYADGGFVYYLSYTGKNLKFFDCETCVSTSICPDYDKLMLRDSYYFEDGQLELELEGADGLTYSAVVDKQGNYVVEPYIKGAE